MNRIFISDFNENNSLIIEQEVYLHRILNVLRMKKGEKLEIFNKCSVEYLLKIKQIQPKNISVEIIQVNKKKLPQIKINLAVAFPKGKRGDWLVEKATELGVDAIYILNLERSIMQPGEGRINKWRQTSIHAAEQSGRITIPSIEYKKLIEIKGQKIAAIINSENSLNQTLKNFKLDKNQYEITYLVGPEGDWTEMEKNFLIKNNVSPVSLGSTIMRVETASIIGVYELNRWRSLKKKSN